MTVLIPLGARVMVQDIPARDNVSERMKAVGLVPVVLQENAPRSTTGRVVALGSDPLVQENIAIGDIVMFSRHAGTTLHIEGVSYRSLEFHEIISVIKEPSALTPSPESG